MLISRYEMDFLCIDFSSVRTTSLLALVITIARILAIDIMMYLKKIVTTYVPRYRVFGNGLLSKLPLPLLIKSNILAPVS